MDIVVGVVIAAIVVVVGIGTRTYLRSRPATRAKSRRWLPVLWGVGGVVMIVVAVFGMVSHDQWLLPLIIGLGLLGCAAWADFDNRRDTS